MLIPFITPTDNGGLDPVQRMQADLQLKQAMEIACDATPAVIALGKELVGEASQQELEYILKAIHEMLPQNVQHSSKHLQRILVSNSWLVLATLKVCMIL